MAEHLHVLLWTLRSGPDVATKEQKGGEAGSALFGLFAS